MPMIFTDEKVRHYGKYICKIEQKIGESKEAYRERVAEKAMLNDPIEGWEIKTGRPWNDWTRKDLSEFMLEFPMVAFKNPAIMHMVALYMREADREGS